MPRTRKARKQPDSPPNSPGLQALLDDFKRQSETRIQQVESDFQDMIDNYEHEMDLALSRIPPEIRQLTLRELLALDLPDDIESSPQKNDNDVSRRPVTRPTTVKKSKKVKNQTASDDGYVTEGATSLTHTTNTRISRIDTSGSSSTSKEAPRTRSSTRSQTRKDLNIFGASSAKKRGSSAPRASDRAMSKKTTTQGSETEFSTPKTNGNSAFSFMRFPEAGETALSSKGSPLFVSTGRIEKTASVSIPLKNGTLAFYPSNDGLRLSRLPQLDPETLEQLRSLKNHLEKVTEKK